MNSDQPEDRRELEERIALWRGYLLRRQSIREVDVDELEDHLRGQASELESAGLAPDEAFLVAVKRIGDLDELTGEFAREHSDRLWKQLVGSAKSRSQTGRDPGREAFVAVVFAVAAALAVKVPALFGISMSDENAAVYVRNASLFVLPSLFGFFAWKRRLDPRAYVLPVLAFVAAAAFANVYPLEDGSSSLTLSTLHLPIALWLVVGIAYTGSQWGNSADRMNFVRFSGELFIYFALIAAGGVVLTLFTLFTFSAIGLDLEGFAQRWLIPCGAAGAVIIASWLVEAKQSVIENMAPVLTRLFTPLFAIVLLIFLGTMAWTGGVVDVDRELLIGFDLLLILVLGLLLYAVSARDPRAKPNAFDAV